MKLIYLAAVLMATAFNAAVVDGGADAESHPGARNEVTEEIWTD